MRQPLPAPAHDAGFFTSLAAKLARPCPRVARHYDAASGISGLLIGDTAPRFVAVHGARLHAHTFAALGLHLDESIFALDMPGHGYSDRLAGPDYTLTRMAAKLGAALATLESPVVLVGHSLGGICAIAMAHARPDSIAGLVLLDSCPAGAGRPAPAITALHDGSEAEFLSALREVYPGKSHDNLRQIIARDTIATENGRQWLWDHHYFEAAAARQAEQALLWAQLATLAMPVLLISGGRSHAFGDVERAEVGARAPNVVQRVLPHAGHNLHLDAAPDVAAALRDFARTVL